MPRKVALERGWLWTVLPALTVFATSSWAILTQGWGRLGVPVMPMTFGDLRQVTGTAQCILEGLPWDVGEYGCDPFGRPYNYPRSWAQLFALLGWGVKSTETVGWLLLAVLAVAVLGLTHVAALDRATPTARIGFLLVVASPPTWLAVERGNVDIAVFAAIAGALLALGSGKHALGIAGMVVAVAAKLFPIGTVPALFMLRPRRVAFWGVSLALVGLLIALPDLAAISEATPLGTLVSFGGAVLPTRVAQWLGWNLPPILLRASGLTLFAGTYLVVVRLIAVQNAKTAQLDMPDVLRVLRGDQMASVLVAGGAGIFLAAFCLGSNFDYRLIILLIPVAAVARVSRHLSVAFTRTFMGGAIVLSWGTYLLPAPVQFGFDLLGIGVAALLVKLLFDLVARDSPRTLSS